MRIQTILNRVEKFKSFVYGEARLEEQDDGPALVVRMRAPEEQPPVLFRVAADAARRTTAWRNGGSSSCRSGGSWSSWPTGCGGWTASGAG